jgi:CrcB protein
MGTTLSPQRRMLAVFTGGFCGTITRYLLSMLIQSLLGNGWPFDILLINLTGACLLAFFTTLADGTFLIGPTRRLFINVGFLGAYTTFSSLALGDILQFEKGHWFPGILYLLLSITGGILAILAGDLLGQYCVKRTSSHKKTTLRETLNETLHALPTDVNGQNGHVDMQDDVLLPEFGAAEPPQSTRYTP